MAIQECPHSSVHVASWFSSFADRRRKKFLHLIPISNFPQTQQTVAPGSQIETWAPEEAVGSLTLVPQSFALFQEENAEEFRSRRTFPAVQAA